MELSTITFALIGLSGILTVGIFIALWQERSKTEDVVAHNSLDTADEKSNSIIHRASKKARTILVQAELAGIKEVARTKHDTEKLEEAFESHLKELTDRSAAHLEKTSKDIERHYVNLFRNTEEFVSKQIKDNQLRIINQLDLVTKEAERTIDTQADAAREELTKRMEAELNASKKLIRAYKQKQMELVDKEIVEIVSQTMKRTLGKTLTKKDHADLVYRALEQAKQDGFFTQNS